MKAVLLALAAFVPMLSFAQTSTPVADWKYASVYEAAYRGDVDVVSHAIRSGAIHPDALGPSGVSLLAAAASGGNMSVVKCLIENGANPLAPQNAVALPLAAANVDFPMVKYLVAVGIPVNLPKGSGHYEPALLAAMRDNGQEIVLFLIEQGANSKGPNIFGTTALNQASTWGNLKIVEALLAHGADVNERDSCGKTPLMSACAKRQKEVAKLLISKGADPTLIDGYGRCAMSFLGDTADGDLCALCGCVPGNGPPEKKKGG